VNTKLDVVNMIIGYDSKLCLAICANSEDTHFELQAYSLQTLQLVFKKEYDGEYLKMKEIDQNESGTVFVLPYSNNGKFFLSVVDSTGEELNMIDVNKFLGIDDRSKPITGFYEPLITTAILPNEDIFVSVYHRFEMI
jgi:hypothetical protein